MAEAGIVQRGQSILAKTSERLTLPADQAEAEQIIAALHAMAERVQGLHNFRKGLGLAAPQIGIGRAVAVVFPLGGESLALINPRVVEQSVEFDEQYEGCLSFFDLRGRVPRSLQLYVDHCDLRGEKRITMFENAMARLVAHEIDHLEGKLYTDRMPKGVDPIPFAKYQGVGSTWVYPSA